MRQVIFNSSNVEVGNIDNDVFLYDITSTGFSSKIAEPFKSDMTAALICLEGSACIKVNMQEYMITPSTTLIILFGQTCQITNISEDLHLRVILMSQNFSDSLFAGTEKLAPFYLQMAQNAIMQLDNREGVFTHFYDLLKNLTQSPRERFRLEAARHLTLVIFYGYSYEAHRINTTPAISGRKGEIYTKFIELVRENYKRERTINFYADRLCITPKYLSQIVMQTSGKRAHYIIDEYVINECKALLASTDMSIQQVADAMNFPSQSVFGKYFKRIAGVSPKEYRVQSTEHRELRTDATEQSIV